MSDQVRAGGAGLSPSRASALILSASEVCVEALAPYVDLDWRSVRARDLDWSVWDTMVHVNDDLYFYGAQVLLADESDYICFELSADAHADSRRLLAALATHARLLAGAVAFADPRSRAHHVYGVSDPVGFAAMGVLESLVHTFDAVHGLDSSSTWRPPDDLAAPVLSRLFPDPPAGAADSSADALLYLCGRTSLADLPRLTDWRWHSAGPDSPNDLTPGNA